MTERKGSILYIGGFELPDKNAAAQRVISNGMVFRKLGYKVVYIGIHKEDNKLVQDTIQDEYLQFATYAMRYPTNKKSWFNYLTNSAPYEKIANTIEDLKVVICYNFPSIALRKMIKYCQRNNIKCVADVTEWYSGEGRPLAERILKDSDTFFRMKILHKRMDGLIVISKYLNEYYSKNANVIYIPPLTIIRPERVNFLKSKTSDDKQNDVLKLVYAGSPGHKDRLDYLISAIGNVNRKVKLRIIGITKDQYTALYPEACGIQIDDNVEFLGRVSHDEVIRLLAEANYSVFIRDITRVTQAGFPTKFAEAISSGIPVITNASSNVTDYISDGRNGILVTELSVKEIENVIEKAPISMQVDSDTFYYERFVESVSAWLSGFRMNDL